MSEFQPVGSKSLGSYMQVFIVCHHFVKSFDIQRRDLLAKVLALVRPFGLSNPSNEVLTQLLMYGNKDFPDEINRNILELTLRLIHETGRFD